MMIRMAAIVIDIVAHTVILNQISSDFGQIKHMVEKVLDLNPSQTEGLSVQKHHCLGCLETLNHPEV